VTVLDGGKMFDREGSVEKWCQLSYWERIGVGSKGLPLLMEDSLRMMLLTQVAQCHEISGEDEPRYKQR